jgi:citrate lyase beta subunit
LRLCLTFARLSSTAELAHIRSLLFAPGSDEGKLLKAFESGADAVVADLEDAVAPGEKERAREVVALLLRGTVPRAKVSRIVRVNGAETSYFQEDLALIRELQLDAVVLPKATPHSVAALRQSGPPVIAIVETAKGLRQAYETGTNPRVAALVLGAVDLGTELGLEPRGDGQEILYARSKVVVDSAAAGIRPPFDVVHLDTRDDEGLEEQCCFARSLGFRGEACIHPAQVPIVNRVFAPSSDEIDWAEKVIAAFEGQEKGVLALNGSMIDLPVVERARRVLAEAKGATE